MATNLKWIGEKARKEPDLVFSSVYHHIVDVDNLRACYDNLEADKATGVDGVTKQQYAASSSASSNWASELLRHNGQLGEVFLLRLSHDTDFVQMA